MYALWRMRMVCLTRTYTFKFFLGLRPATLLKKRLWHRCFAVKFAKFLRKPFVTEHLLWLLLTAANFLIVPRICTIQNTSHSLAKAHLRTSFLRNSSQWLLSNASYFLKEAKNRNNCSYLPWPYAWNVVTASKLKSFSFMILNKILLQSIFQFF